MNITKVLFVLSINEDFCWARNWPTFQPNHVTSLINMVELWWNGNELNWTYRIIINLMNNLYFTRPSPGFYCVPRGLASTSWTERMGSYVFCYVVDSWIGFTSMYQMHNSIGTCFSQNKIGCIWNGIRICN